MGALTTTVENRSIPKSVITRAFDILRAFPPPPRVISVGEIAQATGLPKSTAYRVLATLADVGAVKRVHDGYMIGIGMFAPGSHSLDDEHLDASLPVLRRLQSITGRTVHLACLSGDRVTFLNKLPGSQSPFVPTLVGGQSPARATATGKALLAFVDPEQTLLSQEEYAQPTSTLGAPEPLGGYLRSISLYGFTVQREELITGVSCVAAPIIVGGTAIAAVSVTLHASDERLRLMGTVVRRAADALASALRVLR